MVGSSFPLFDRLGAPFALLERSFFMRFAAFAREAPSADDAPLRHRHSAHPHGSDTTHKAEKGEITEVPFA